MDRLHPKRIPRHDPQQFSIERVGRRQAVGLDPGRRRDRGWGVACDLERPSERAPEPLGDESAERAEVVDRA
jgi:hypothetical protein